MIWVGLTLFIVYAVVGSIAVGLTHSVLAGNVVGIAAAILYVLAWRHYIRQRVTGGSQ